MLGLGLSSSQKRPIDRVIENFHSVWYADRAETITESSNNVSNVKNIGRSGLDFAQAGSDAAKPDLGVIGGIPCLDFDGSNTYMAAGTVASYVKLHDLTGATIWVVVRNDADPASLEWFIGTENDQPASETGFSMYYNPDQQLAMRITGGGNTIGLLVGSVGTFQDSQYIVAGARIGTEAGSDNDMILYSDGFQIAAADQGATPSTGNSTDVLTLGRNHTGRDTNSHEGQIAAVIYEDRKVSLDEYLAVNAALMGRFNAGF